MPAPRLTAVTDLVGVPGGQDAALLSVLLDAAPVGFAHYDRDARYLHINAALAAANGAPPEAHLGRTVREMAPVLAVEISGVDDRGHLSHWTTGWYPVPDPVTGACVGVAVVATDITSVVDEGEALRRTAMTLQLSLIHI